MMSKRVHPECDDTCTHKDAVPGPRVVPSGVPVLAGPPAYLPSEPGPAVSVLPRAYVGPTAPYPLNPATFSRVRPVEVTGYPKPEITSRDGQTGPVKSAVATLAKYAEALGWTVEVTYARGSFPHATLGTPGVTKDSLALKMQCGPVRAVAVYEGGSTWSWGTLCILDGRHRPYATITAFKAALTGYSESGGGDHAG